MLDREKLNELRTEIGSLRAQVVKADVAIRAGRNDLATLRRLNSRANEIRGTSSQIDELVSGRDELNRKIRDLEKARDRLRGRISSVSSFESSIKQLDANIPIAMLPVRLETRFVNQNRELLVRIYPDTVHQNGHEQELTDVEREAAQQYWDLRWKAKSDEDHTAAWQTLARTYTPTRARWIAAATTPKNIDDMGNGSPNLPDVAERAAPWTRPALGRQLPERWVMLGYRNDKEIVRVWGSRPVADHLPMGPAPDLDHTDDPRAATPDQQDGLPIDDGMRWLVNFDAAEAAGMALRVKNDDVEGGLADGFDMLMVVGVDWTLDPEKAAAELTEHVAAHGYSDGVSFPPVGTATNVTENDELVGAGNLRRDPDLIDPTQPQSPRSDAAEPRFRQAFGLGEQAILRDAPGADDRSDLRAKQMQIALWAPTWGHFLEEMMEPLLSAGQVQNVQNHAARYVRGRGPLPTLRIGKQPYGVLPVMSSAHWKAKSSFEQSLHDRIQPLRGLWIAAGDRIEGLVDGGDPDEILVDLLRRAPRSRTYRFRQALDVAVARTIAGMDNTVLFQEVFSQALLSLAGIEGRPEIVDVTVMDKTEPLPIPIAEPGGKLSVSTGNPSLVTNNLLGNNPLVKNYIATVHERLTRSGGFKQIMSDPSDATSLLEALLRQAAKLEMSRASFLLALEDSAEDNPGKVTDLVIPREDKIHLASQATKQPEVQIAGFKNPLKDGETKMELANRSFSGTTGRATLANHIASKPTGELRRQFSTRRFADFRSSLNGLRQLPSATLADLTAETLDCASHRLDAWVTSMASSRLDSLRRERPTGVHIGGYGWVEGLRPGTGGRSQGYVHAPSVGQATTAAMLLSGHLSRKATADSVFGIDLSSERTTRALEILSGIRQGQPIGALLGYRFERGLRERQLSLAQYILDFRQAAPLDTATDRTPDGEPIESIAARDVVDGVKLVDQARADRTALLVKVGVASGDRAAVGAEIDAMADLLDAVSDVLLAEGVHQAVMGNTERSAAALDALDRQSPIPDVGVVRTPRTGVGVTHRLMVALEETEMPADWAGSDDIRSAAAPRLNAWFARALGDPSDVRFSALARTIADDGTATDVAIDPRLTDLGLSPLSTVLAAVGGGAESLSSELQERLAEHCFNQEPDADEVHFFDDPPSGSPSNAMGLAELTDLCRSLADLVSSARPATTTDWEMPTERPTDEYDSAELQRRADKAVAALQRVYDRLPGEGSGASSTTLRSSLRDAAAVGVRAAVPTTQSSAVLLEMSIAAKQRAAASLEQLTALENSFTRADATSAVQVAHDTSRLQTIFGENFPVVPLVKVSNDSELVAAVARSSSLVDGDPMAITSWVQQQALVRPSVQRLHDALAQVEMRNGDLDACQFDVVQLSAAAANRWVGLPLVDGEPFPVGASSLVVHHLEKLTPDKPLAALVIDQWSEAVPNRSETTGVSLHFDAPGARAPQAILLAVPPNLEASEWSLDKIIGSVHEARDLSRMRSADLDVLDAATRFLPATYLTFNIEEKTPSFNPWELADVGITLANAEFAEREF